LTGRHQLQLANLYPYLIRYLQPKQKDVTRILACLVESSHQLVPPEMLRPAVVHVINTFVTDAQTPEVIQVGMHTLREICSRCASVLDEDQIADLTGFRKYKNKGVVKSTRQFIKVFRNVNPQIMHRSLRGREAQMALSRGEMKVTEFGEHDAVSAIDGLDLLVQKWEKDKKGDTNEQVDLVPKKTQEELANIMTDTVLSPDDFKRLKRLRLQRSIRRQLGGKRKREEVASSSGSDGDDESDEDKSDAEQGLTGRLPGGIAGSDIKNKIKMKMSKAQRMAHVEAGRTDTAEKFRQIAEARRGGKTNKEKGRSKPTKMVEQSRNIQRKKVLKAKEKLKNLRTHIKTLKKKSGGKPKRRR